MHNRRYKKASSRITRRNKIRRVFGLVFKIGLPAALLIGLVFLSRADFLKIKKIEVIGAEMISAEDIENVAGNLASGTKFFVIPKSNIFIFNKEKLANALFAEFTRLQGVEVNKQFFTKNIELKITERKADFLWCSVSDKCFFMTKDGLVFEKAGFTASDFLTSSVKWAEPLNKMIFMGVLDGDPLMKNFATPAEMQNYLNLVEVFDNADFEIISISIESSEKAVAKSNVGDIIFNPEENNLSLVAENTILLINDIKSKTPSARFDYLDVRFGNKIFYKLF